MIVPILLVFFSLEVKVQEIQKSPQVDTIQDIKINLDHISMPDVRFPKPTMLDRVQTVTSNFLDSVQNNLHETDYVWYTSSVNLKKETQCLAQNIYYEARGEPIEGKLAVVNATINRVRSFLYPRSICGVVWQRLQFSWTKMHIKYKEPRDILQWKEAQLIAERALKGGRLDNLKDITKGAINFHATKVHPHWKMEETIKIGNHIFYRPKLSS